MLRNHVIPRPDGPGPILSALGAGGYYLRLDAYAATWMVATPSRAASLPVQITRGVQSYLYANRVGFFVGKLELLLEPALAYVLLRAPVEERYRAHSLLDITDLQSGPVHACVLAHQLSNTLALLFFAQVSRDRLLFLLATEHPTSPGPRLRRTSQNAVNAKFNFGECPFLRAWGNRLSNDSPGSCRASSSSGLAALHGTPQLRGTLVSSKFGPPRLRGVPSRSEAARCLPVLRAECLLFLLPC